MVAIDGFANCYGTAGLAEPFLRRRDYSNVWLIIFLSVVPGVMLLQLRLLEETASASALAHANKAMTRQAGLSAEASSAGAAFASIVEVRRSRCMLEWQSSWQVISCYKAYLFWPQ